MEDILFVREELLTRGAWSLWGGCGRQVHGIPCWECFPSIHLSKTLSHQPGCWEGGRTIERVVLASLLSCWVDRTRSALSSACNLPGMRSLQAAGRWVGRSLGQGIRNRLLNGTGHPGWALSGLCHTPASPLLGVSQKGAGGPGWYGMRGGAQE